MLYAILESRSTPGHWFKLHSAVASHTSRLMKVWNSREGGICLKFAIAICVLIMACPGSCSGWQKLKGNSISECSLYGSVGSPSLKSINFKLILNNLRLPRF